MSMLQVTLLVSALIGMTVAKCGCGYSVNNTNQQHHAVFTELFETDFLHVDDISYNATYSIGWEPQNYNQSATEGPYGMAKESTNLIPNYIGNPCDWDGPGVRGTSPGLQLWARSHLLQRGAEHLVPCAEIVSERDDILYGSFRIAMKTTTVNGTVGAFFFYRNNSQEIDVEILSSQQRQQQHTWPIHLVVQNTSTAVPVNLHSSQNIYNLPLAAGPPSANYDEYRFDWLPSRIDYFFNSQYIWTLTENIPSTPGRIHISHWSNGNAFWSAGPPDQDAVLSVSYVKAYFNSTNTTREAEYDAVCGPTATDEMSDDVCVIPDQKTPPDPFGPEGNRTGRTFFFTQQQNMTVNQTVYGGSSTSGSVARFSAAAVIWFAWAMVVMSFAAGIDLVDGDRP